MRKAPNWYVITGGPNSGKTTIIQYLSTLGYHTVSEYSRLLIDIELSKGKTIEQIRGNAKLFQERALKFKLKSEEKTPRNEIVFLDRGVPDTVAYYRFLRLKMSRHLLDISKNRYKKVFLLEMLPYKNDYARIESEKEARQIHEIIKQTYEELGYEVVRVPVTSVEDRAKIILKHIK